MPAKTIVITGAARGINAAAAAWLRAEGHRVIGVDRLEGEVDIVADLSTSDGRAAMIADVERLAPGGIDGVVAGAGVLGAGPAGGNAANNPRVNYFGAVATLEGLRPLLLKSPTPRAVAILSTAVLMPASPATVSACLRGDEAAAVEAVEADPRTSYMATKKALGHWLRRTAISPDWAGRGIALNGVAPGGVYTAMLPARDENPEAFRILLSSTPKAVADYAQPEDLAELIAFLATMERGYLLGQVIYCDGGTEAIQRTETF